MVLFFVFLFVFSGLNLISGTFANAESVKMFTSPQKKMIQKLSFALLLVCFLIFSGKIFSIFLFFPFYFLFLRLFILFVRKNRENKFKKDVHKYLDRIILHLRAGKSFRAALVEANRPTEAFSQQKIAQIIDIVFQTAFSNSFAPKNFAEELTNEFISIDKSAHKALQRIISLRRSLAIELEFREKVGQATLKSRVQCYALSFLYFALALVMIFLFSFERILPFLIYSVPIFVTGLLWLVFIGRSLRWKV